MKALESEDVKKEKDPSEWGTLDISSGDMQYPLLRTAFKDGSCTHFQGPQIPEDLIELVTE